MKQVPFDPDTLADLSGSVRADATRGRDAWAQLGDLIADTDAVGAGAASDPRAEQVRARLEARAAQIADLR